MSWSDDARKQRKEREAQQKAAGEAQPASGGGAKPKRRYTRRGPVCPVCRATMDVDPKTGQATCRFAGSHASQRAVQEQNKPVRGSQPATRGTWTRRNNPHLWKTRPEEPEEGKGGKKKKGS